MKDDGQLKGKLLPLEYMPDTASFRWKEFSLDMTPNFAMVRSLVGVQVRENP